MTEPTTAERLREIRQSWDMSRAEFAGLLGTPLATYHGWENQRTPRPIPAHVQRHVQTIHNLRLIYQHWNEIGDQIAGTEEFDAITDEHEQLWGELFPQLRRTG